MFHRYCRSGYVVIGIGVGMLLSCLLQFWPICTLCGVGMIIVGLLMTGKG